MSAIEKLILYTDRSAAELDDKCGMAFWLNRHEAGGGVVLKEESIPLAIGRATHEDLLAIAKMDDLSDANIQAVINDILSPITEDDKFNQTRMEMLYRRVGWLAAFAIYIEPRIREEYDTLAAEDEIILARDPLFVGVTPDRVLRAKKTGDIVYREYKTTIRADQKWLQSWAYAIQMHIGIAAIEEEVGRKIAFGQVMGLMKGYYSFSGERKLMHPYVWGYYNTVTGDWTHDYDKARARDWISMPVWEYEPGVVEWVRLVGEEIALRQFPHTAPIFLNRRMLDEWVVRRTVRERKVQAVKGLCRDSKGLRGINFERRTRNCRPPFGDQCPYLQACWNAEIGDDPLASGLYERRQPHHEVEIVGIE